MTTLSSSLRLILSAVGMLLLISCSTVPETGKNKAQSSDVPVNTPAPVVQKTSKQPKVQPVTKTESVNIVKVTPKAKPVIKTPVVKKPEPVKKITPINIMPKKVSPPSMPASAVAGRVSILGKGNKTYSPADVIVSLTPIDAGVKFRPQNANHKIVTRNKTYNPAVMTILKGDTLDFQNRDQIKHNVFSSSKENIFDLGTYGKGRDRSIKMNKSGIVKVYCNIHAEMATFIMVAENEFNDITDKKGMFEIKDVPPGEYKLSLWHVRGSLERIIVVSPSDTNALALTLNTATYKPVEHKNKFGKNYKKRPALFEDEFY